MAGKGLASIIRQGARTLAGKQPAQPSYALAFSSKSGSSLKLMSGPPPNRQDLLIRCGGDEKRLEALIAQQDGDLNGVDSLLRNAAEGLITIEIVDGKVRMGTTKKGALYVAERDAEIHRNSVY
jgi:hypothetical protein